MSRATIRIVNRTSWRTDHLRAFVVAAREQVFGPERKPLTVEFAPGRSAWVHGRAALGGSWSRLTIPATDPDKRLLAQILVHELAHNAGAAGERWMRRSKSYGVRHPEWRENVAWADALPLERKEPKRAAPVKDVIGSKLARLAEREAAWRSKAKRAATALRKIARSRTYYVRKLAAAKGGAL